MYEGGTWKVEVFHLDYPTMVPVIIFLDEIYHPNIVSNHFACVNLLNSDWNSEFTFYTIFEYILPDLILHPNLSDALNIKAARELEKNPKLFQKKVRKLIENQKKSN